MKKILIKLNEKNKRKSRRKNAALIIMIARNLLPDRNLS